MNSLLSQLSTQLTPAGIATPTYPEVLAQLQDDFRRIYGTDVYLDADSQDGQLLAILARAIFDTNQTVVKVYESFSPATAIGAALSNNVRLNGLQRSAATYSTVDLKIVGQVGTVINQGIVQSAQGSHWALPETVTIPTSGEIVVTATCQQIGAVAAEVGSINQIATPTRGWQSVINLNAAVIGSAVESDASLRRRQALATALPARSVLESVIAAVTKLDGVKRFKAIENDTSNVNEDGIAPHSIALIIEGGDAQAIAATIAKKKTPGTGTFGNTSERVVDAYGVSYQICFSRPIYVDIDVKIEIKGLIGYTSLVGEAIKQAVVDHINLLGIGESVLVPRLYVPVNLSGHQDSLVYELVSLTIEIKGKALAPADIKLAFNQVAHSVIDNINLKIN